MNEAMKAMKISGKVIAIIMKITYIVMIVVACFLAAVLVFLAVTGDTSVVTSSGLKIAAADDALSPGSAMAACAALLVMAAFLFVISLLVHRMFREISKTGVPFKPEYVKTIKTVGVLLAAMSVAGGFAESVAASTMGTDALGMANNAPGVLVGVIVYCFAYVFEYGCAMQRRVNEAEI